jgi:hypothetical protein
MNGLLAGWSGVLLLVGFFSLTLGLVLKPIRETKKTEEDGYTIENWVEYRWDRIFLFLGVLSLIASAISFYFSTL